MSCEYCKYKTINKPLVESENNTEGVSVWIQKRDDGTYLCVEGWYDGGVSIIPNRGKINYCPMCGRRLVEE